MPPEFHQQNRKGFRSSFVKLEGLAYPLSIICLSALTLFSIWSNRFLPLQDYPQHLFIAFATATFENTTFNWQHFFDSGLNLAPYNLSYLIIGTLSKVVSIEAAGKLFISLILGLYTTFALTQKKTDAGSAPWVLMLLFPIFFNQIFYFGFLNYLFALPILMFTLRVSERVAQTPFLTPAFLPYVLLLLLLFFSHPFALVLYLFLGGWFLLFGLDDRAGFKRLFTILFMTGLLFTAWYLQLPTPEGYSSFTWAPPVEGSLRFLLLMFTGMNFSGGIEWNTTLLWFVVFITIVISAYQSRTQFHLSRLYVALTVSALVLFFILPFHFGHYAVFNFRLAPLTYLLGLVLISAVPLPRFNVAVLAMACLALLLISNQRHRNFSDETASILPVLEKMSSNARIFPVYNDSTSAEFDSGFFYQIHVHDHFYYHVLAGGGVSPVLFVNAMLPIKYKPGMRPPTSTATLADLLEAYDYVLIRKPRYEDLASLSGLMTLVEQSADWVVFANPDSLNRDR